MRETGVGVLDIEFVRITPDLNVADLEPFLASGAELGARYVITAPYDPEPTRLADRRAPSTISPCDTVFTRCWNSFRGRLRQTSARPPASSSGRAASASFHTLHFDRSGSTVEQLSKHAAFASSVRACGRRPGPEELHHGRIAPRRPRRAIAPGEGGIDIRNILKHLPAGIPLALEVPMTGLSAAEGFEAVALRARRAASRLLGV